MKWFRKTAGLLRTPVQMAFIATHFLRPLLADLEKHLANIENFSDHEHYCLRCGSTDVATETKNIGVVFRTITWQTCRTCNAKVNINSISAEPLLDRREKTWSSPRARLLAKWLGVEDEPDTVVVDIGRFRQKRHRAS